jgi:hypothetical protein
MEKVKNFYKQKLRPKRKQMNNTQMKKPLIHHPIGEHQHNEYEWAAVRETHKKKEPPLIDHSKVFQ